MRSTLIGAASVLVIGALAAPGPASAAPPPAVLTAADLPAGYTGYRTKVQSGEVAMVPSGDTSARCLDATAAAATATRGAQSREASAQRDRFTLMVAALSAPAGAQLGDLLDRCSTGDRTFRPVAAPADLARFAPRLYWDSAGDERVAYVTVRNATVVVRTVGPAEPFWETLRKQVALTDR
ncbi:hypothetical protein [Tsukamurella sp. 1534]|uniref:hypothetical protein n=1 Tax=Tsukamurella sp. 1534 TaxID=1151061 RepID=UPI0002F523B5|nr:hypothetical protein [Tsukamurella sp. 1534]